MSADIRRASRVVGRHGIEPVDRRIYAIQQGRYREILLDLVAAKPGGRVLDICCGPGWLALELGRRGQRVEAYDLSPAAIALARRMLEENPYREGFGAVHYHLADVSKVDLGIETFDAVTGWSAFHHLPDFRAFMKKVHAALKPGGIVATLDDYPQGALESYLKRFFGLILPTTDRSYREKVVGVIRRLGGRTVDKPEIFSPMEQRKYSTVEDIQEVFRTEFELVHEFKFNAFAIGPMLLLAGPDWFRYPLAQLLEALDRFGCWSGWLIPNVRILISRKRP
jgi:ubiquinone/menaquinone biosynthesis C-methylase UbiE